MSGNRAGAAHIHQPLKTPEPHSASTVWGKIDLKSTYNQGFPVVGSQIESISNWLTTEISAMLATVKFGAMLTTVMFDDHAVFVME